MAQLFRYIMFLTRKSTGSGLIIEISATSTLEALKEINRLYPEWTASDKMRVIG